MLGILPILASCGADQEVVALRIHDLMPKKGARCSVEDLTKKVGEPDIVTKGKGNGQIWNWKCSDGSVRINVFVDDVDSPKKVMLVDWLTPDQPPSPK